MGTAELMLGGSPMMDYSVASYVSRGSRDTPSRFMPLKLGLVLAWWFTIGWYMYEDLIAFTFYSKYYKKSEPFLLSRFQSRFTRKACTVLYMSFNHDRMQFKQQYIKWYIKMLLQLVYNIKQ